MGREGLATFSGAFPAGGGPGAGPGTSPSTKSAAGSPDGGSAPPLGSVGVIAIGRLVAAAEDLEAAGIDITLWGARCGVRSTPRWSSTSRWSSIRRATVVTLEDRMRGGGIGLMMAGRVRAIDPEIAVRVVGLPTRFIRDAATPDEILSSLGLDQVRVAKTVKELGDAFLD